MFRYFFILLLWAGSYDIALSQTDTTQSPLFRFDTGNLLALPAEAIDVQVTTSSKNAEGLRDASASITVISAYDIEDYGALTLRDLLDRVVNTYVTGSFFMPNNIVSIRGDMTNGFNTHVLVLLDGRPMRENLFSGFNSSLYSGIALSGIERIEVVRGPGSVLYGSSAFAGVINIILKKGKKRGTQASQTIGSHNTLIAEIGTGFDKNKWKVSSNFRILNTAGWNFKSYDHDQNLIDEPVSQRGASANLNVQNGGFQLSSLVSVGRDNVFAEGEFIKIQPYRQVQNTRIFADLGYHKELTKWWTMYLNLTYNRSRYYEDIAVSTSNTRGNYHDAFSTDFLIEGYSYFKPIKNLNILAGGSGNIIRGEFTQPHRTPDGALYDYAQGAINTNPRISTPLYRERWISYYTQADYSLPKWKFLAGAQYNLAVGKQSIAPRVGIIFKPNAVWAGKLMYGEAFRTGSSYERLSTEEESYGNNDLNPEKMHTLEANLAYTHPKKKAYFSLTAYRSWAENLITLSNPDDSLFIYFTGESVPFYINFEKLQYQGIELEGKFNLSKRWQVSSAFSWQDVIHSKEEGGVFHNYAGIPPLMLKTGLLYKDAQKGVTIGVFNSYFSKATELNIFNNNEIPRNYNTHTKNYYYLTLNVKLDIRTILNIDNMPYTTFSLFVQNALNEKIYYADYARSDVNSVAGRGGRGIYAKASVKF